MSSTFAFQRFNVYVELQIRFASFTKYWFRVTISKQKISVLLTELHSKLMVDPFNCYYAIKKRHSS